MPIKVDTVSEKMAQSRPLFHKSLVPVDNKSRHMSWKQDLGRQIRQERDSAGMTQAELAKHLDVSRQMVGRYEAGKDAPAGDGHRKICVALRAGYHVTDVT